MDTESTRLQSDALYEPPVNKTYRFDFLGSGGTLFGIQIVNLFLILITLGIYYFWAKVKVRNYIWSQIEFDQDRLAYHGLAKEALTGWLKAMLVFGIPFFLCQNIPVMLGGSQLMIAAGALLSGVIIWIFLPIAMVGMRRYRYSRTSLRGLRFSFRGRWTAFARFFYKSLFLNLITLGLYMPYYEIRKNRFFLEHTYYGDTRFRLEGAFARDLFKKYVLACLLALPTLLLSLLWYHVYKTRYIMEHTTFQGARFHLDITFGAVLWLFVSNILILIFTLGFGAPWVKVRMLRYYLGNLKMKGYLDFAAIRQEMQDGQATGEEIGGFLELDFDLG